jgi:hypothetical protein
LLWKARLTKETPPTQVEGVRPEMLSLVMIWNKYNHFEMNEPTPVALNQTGCKNS